MAADLNAKRPVRLGRGLTSLMGGPVVAETTPPSAADGSVPRARLATTPPPEILAEGINEHISTTTPAEVKSAIAPSGPALVGLTTISVGRIRPNRHQPRKQFDARALEQLAASIRLDGLIQPIIVRTAEGGAYELIAGERRWRAAQLAGLAAIPAIIRDLGERDAAEWALIENLQREDLNPIERGEAFAKLVDQYQLSHEQVAERVGVDRSSITNAMRLLGLHKDLQQFVRDGLLSAGQAKALAGLSDIDAQRELGVRAVREAWSVRQVEQAVREVTEAADDAMAAGEHGSDGKPKAKAGRSPHTIDLERQITEQLGTKVRIQQSRKKGTGSIAIDFYSLEQFDDLLAKLGIKIEEA